MSKKVKFYMWLDIGAIAIILFVRALLCKSATAISETFLQTGTIILINVISGAVCLVIVFFFLL